MNPKNSGALFLKEFTRHLILNSKRGRNELFSHHPVRIREEQTQHMPVLFPPRFASILLQAPKYPLQIPERKILEPPVNPAVASISPVPQQIPEGFSIDKLNPFLSDKTLTMIECPGPGKPVLVRSMGRISATRLILSEPEIKKILETFSKFSKIPLIEGIFKAAVGNLVITAVSSDFVGSRFVINKYTPYSILE